MPNKFEAVMPDGNIGKRSSKSRFYSHCVAVRRSYENALANAKREHPTDRRNFEYHRAYLDGSSKHLKKLSWESDERYAERVEKAIEDAKKWLRGFDNVDDWIADCIKRAIASVEQAKAEGAYDRWAISGWCGRADLAAKLFASESNKDWIAEAKILEAKQVK